MMQITEVAPQEQLLKKLARCTDYGCVLTVSGLTHIFCLIYKPGMLKQKANLSKPALASYQTPSSLESLLETVREVKVT